MQFWRLLVGRISVKIAVTFADAGALLPYGYRLMPDSKMTLPEKQAPHIAVHVGRSRIRRG